MKKLLFAFIMLFSSFSAYSQSVDIYITERDQIEVVEDFIYVNGRRFYIEIESLDNGQIVEYFVRDIEKPKIHYRYIIDRRKSPVIIHNRCRWPYREHRRPIIKHERRPYSTRQPLIYHGSPKHHRR